jgi:WD40 repeat protein
VLEPPSGYEPEVNPHDGAPLSVAWNPPGDQLAVAFDVWGIVMYDGETLEIEELYGNGGYFLNGYPGLQSLTWSPDGRFLATDGISFMDGSDIVVRILEVSTGEFTFIPGQEEIINAVVWSPSGDFIVTGTGRFPTPSQDNSLRIWDTTTYEQIQELLFDTPITSISWNPNSTQLAAVDLDGAVYIIDVQG